METHIENAVWFSTRRLLLRVFCYIVVIVPVPDIWRFFSKEEACNAIASLDFLFDDWYFCRPPTVSSIRSFNRSTA